MMNGRSAVAAPVGVIEMPHWPFGGASMLLKLAEKAAEMNGALSVKFADRSGMAIAWALKRDFEIQLRWPELYDSLGEPPYLDILVFDNGVGIKDGKRVREHEAERRLAEVHKLVGKDKKMGIVVASIDVTDSRRRYFWKVY